MGPLHDVKNDAAMPMQRMKLLRVKRFMATSCSLSNSMPSAMGGPATTTVNVACGANGSTAVHVSGAGFEAMDYTVYAANTKTHVHVGLE